MSKERETDFGLVTAGVRMILKGLGEDEYREGLTGTPLRVAKFYEEFLNPPEFKFTTFDNDGSDEMIIQSDIEFAALCVVGSTFVETPRGRIPIEWLRHGDWVYTVDPITRELGLAQAENPRLTRHDAEIVRVYTDNDTVLCTPDHRFLTLDGRWVEAKDLRNNDRLVSLYRTAHHHLNRESEAYPALLSRQSQRGEGIQINGGRRKTPEHRFVLAIIGNPLAAEQHLICHHIDEQVWNNVPENLEAITCGEHNRRHQRTLKLANNENRKRAAAASSGREEVRRKRSESLKRYHANMTDQEREDRGRKISLGRQAAGNHVVFGVEAVTKTADVWCLTVPGTHTYFTNGIASHNCEHHMLPFIGAAAVAYIPNGRIVGLSKLARCVDSVARGLQNQERITKQVADSLQEALQPKGVAVILKARHLCVEIRGVKKRGTLTTTSCLLGVFKSDPAARAEFLSLANNLKV